MFILKSTWTRRVISPDVITSVPVLSTSPTLVITCLVLRCLLVIQPTSVINEITVVTMIGGITQLVIGRQVRKKGRSECRFTAIPKPSTLHPFSLGSSHHVLSLFSYSHTSFLQFFINRFEVIKLKKRNKTQNEFKRKPRGYFRLKGLVKKI